MSEELLSELFSLLVSESERILSNAPGKGKC